MTIFSVMPVTGAGTSALDRMEVGTFVFRGLPAFENLWREAHDLAGWRSIVKSCFAVVVEKSGADLTHWFRDWNRGWLDYPKSLAIHSFESADNRRTQQATHT